MKRIFAVLLVLCFLTGCGSSHRGETPPEPTPEEVADAYWQAAEVYDWFDAVSPPCEGEAVEVDGNSWRPVAVEGLAAYADLEAKVRSLFTPELADTILSESQNFRDLNGRLHCAEGGRGSNIFLYDKTLRVDQPEPHRFTVTLTFWTNTQETASAAPPATETTFGYSTEVLDYVRTEEGYRFASFCSSDGLDLEADTVHTFRGMDGFETGAWQDYDDWKLICYLTHTDGAAAEPPMEELMRRFLKTPQEMLTQLALLYESPFYGVPAFSNIDQLTISPAYTAAAFLFPDELPDFDAALEACLPETGAQQEVLELMRREFTALTEEAPAYDPLQEFGLLVPGDKLFLRLGEQEGAFPWGYELNGEVTAAYPTDHGGTLYEMDCGALQLTYSADPSGFDLVKSLSTAADNVDANGYYCTPRGFYCGYAEEDLVRLYLHAQKQPISDDPAYESLWLYTPGGEAENCQIAFYANRGIIEKIAVLDITEDAVPENAGPR